MGRKQMSGTNSGLQKGYSVSGLGHKNAIYLNFDRLPMFSPKLKFGYILLR